jgi:1-deoxy-D-xylulose-5-phosphate synthase
LRRETKRRAQRRAISLRQHAAPGARRGGGDDATWPTRFVKPDELIERLARTHDGLVTIEENVIAGGAGSAVAETLAQRGIVVPLLHLGLPDAFIDQGDPGVQLAHCGLDAKGIAAAIVTRFGARRADVASVTPIAKPAA